jgi:hypothetical protein
MTQISPNQRRSSLVFSSVGDSSDACNSWNSGPRDYDIAIAYFGDDEDRAHRLSDLADYFFRSKGSKFQNFSNCWPHFEHDLFWIVDDDIELPPSEITECFRQMITQKLGVASPAHSRSGRLSWAHMARSDWSRGIRRANFVEMTAPFLSRVAAERFLRAYRPYQHDLVGFGIDFIISDTCRNMQTRIFDFCEIENPHPEKRLDGLRAIDQLQPDSERQQQWGRIAHRFNFCANDVWCQPSPTLSSTHVNRIREFVDPSSVILELGTGGNTFFYADIAKTIHSVEYSAQKLAKIKFHLPDYATFHFVPPNNPVSEPVWIGREEDFNDYLQFLKKLDPGHFNLIHVGGRVRAKTALTCLPLLADDGHLLFNDWDRLRYRWVLLYYNEIEVIGEGSTQIAVLKPRENWEHLISGISSVDPPTGNPFQHRLDFVSGIIEDLNLPSGSSVLDIGGKDYKGFCQNHHLHYTMLDLEQPLTHGTGGHNADTDGLIYNGRDLPFSSDQVFDIIILSFVLHHAANNTLPILEQLSELSSGYIIVGEDLSEIDYPEQWLSHLGEHQPGGIFRSDQEWRRLFELNKLRIRHQFVLRRSDDPDDRIYRCLYLLQKY